MEKKLNCILLIDDDRITHFATKRIISKLDCAEKVVSVGSGIEALTFLTNKTDAGYEQPDLIFLDINMPGMNGWEFLEEYRNLSSDKHGNMVIVMLTTSLNPDDRERAEGIIEIDQFKNKPLKKEDIESIIEQYFADRV